MDKLKLTEQNLGQVFNFKCGHVYLYLTIEQHVLDTNARKQLS
jgi:hypothetical protein